MGDQVLAGITPNIGVYATEPEADPLAEWLASILDLSAYARDRHLVLPGHRLPFTGLPARLDEMARHHAGTLDRLQEALDVPATACGLFPVLFGRDIPDSEYGLALVEAVAHLNHLRATGRAIRRSGEDGVWLWQSVE
jgi:glyoxylase-like metal-dependent hydrolase (beta-lactamase superfamily II)